MLVEAVPSAPVMDEGDTDWPVAPGGALLTAQEISTPETGEPLESVTLTTRGAGRGFPGSAVCPFPEMDARYLAGR